MEVVAVQGQKRTDLGKKATKAVRNEQRIPCVLYGGEKVVHFTTTPYEVRDLIYTPDFRPADVIVDGETLRCIVKDIQFHPVTEEILHIDFLRMIKGVPIKLQIPVRFEGSAPGVKNGGRLIQNVRRVTVKALPENLVGELRLDVSELEMGDSLRVRDIELEEGLSILDAPGLPIATVLVPRILKTPTPTAEEGLEDELGPMESEEGEVEGEGEGAAEEGEGGEE